MRIGIKWARRSAGNSPACRSDVFPNPETPKRIVSNRLFTRRTRSVISPSRPLNTARCSSRKARRLGQGCCASRMIGAAPLRSTSAALIKRFAQLSLVCEFDRLSLLTHVAGRLALAKEFLLAHRRILFDGMFLGRRQRRAEYY